MKLVIVTVVEQYQKEVLKLLKKADIENFSSSDIDGHKNGASLLMTSNWFSAEKESNESSMLFSFTDDQHINLLFEEIKDFNGNLETNNPIKAVVIPIERFI